MTYDLSDEQTALRDVARQLARDRVAGAARTIDDAGTIPGEMLQDAQKIVASANADPTALVVVVEELAAESAAVAAAAALGQTADTVGAADASGLRGFSAAGVAAAQAQLTFAAVALGIGRAAVDFALGVLRDSGRTAQDHEKPHWVVADAATDVQAARLLTLRAAAASVGAEAAGMTAMAKLAASRAAERAVEIALRLGGPAVFKRGTLLERLARDARAVSLMVGTEEELSAIAADLVLPQ